jgi:hypothetical protein
MLACRLNDVNTGEKVGSFPERLAESDVPVAEGEGGRGAEAAVAAAPMLMLDDRPNETRVRRGEEREVDLYSAPALVCLNSGLHDRACDRMSTAVPSRGRQRSKSILSTQLTHKSQETAPMPSNHVSATQQTARLWLGYRDVTRTGDQL